MLLNTILHLSMMSDKCKELLYGLTPWGLTQGQVRRARALLSPAPAKPSLRGAHQHTGQPELSRADNSSGMLSPSYYYA